MKAICGATAVKIVSSAQWQFSGGYSATPGVVLGVGMNFKHGGGLMPDIAAKVAASGQRVSGESTQMSSAKPLGEAWEE